MAQLSKAKLQTKVQKKDGEDSPWGEQESDQEMSPGNQIHKAKMYLDMGLTDQELREVIGLDQRYIDMAKTKKKLRG